MCYLQKAERKRWQANHTPNVLQDRLKKTSIYLLWCGHIWFVQIKERRNTLKRCGALFTCLGSRAIHIKMTKSMDTDSFIPALQPFIATLSSRSLLGQKRSWRNVRANQIAWKENPPMTSHMGGVWERQIRSASTILSSLIKRHSVSLDCSDSICRVEVYLPSMFCICAVEVLKSCISPFLFLANLCFQVISVFSKTRLLLHMSYTLETFDRSSITMFLTEY